MVRIVLSFLPICASLFTIFLDCIMFFNLKWFRLWVRVCCLYFLILGTSKMFSSGSWATLNYLKLLPTPKTFSNSSLIPIMPKNVFSSKQTHLPHKFTFKNNNRSVLRIEETKIKPKSKLNNVPKMKISETRGNSIFDFNVHSIPIKVMRISLIRLYI